MDLTNQTQFEVFKKWVSCPCSAVDILINNTGGLINKLFQQLTIDEWKSMLDVNLMTIVRLTKAVASHDE